MSGDTKLTRVVTNGLLWGGKTNAETAMDGYLVGDHFQRGAGWVGPRVSKQDVIDQLTTTFVGDPVLATCVKRHILAVVGTDPHWYFATKTTPEPVTSDEAGVETTIPGVNSPDEQARIKEAGDFTTTWYKDNKIIKVLREVATRVTSYEAAYPRLYLMSDYQNEDGTLIADTIEEALEAFRFHLPARESSGVIEDVHGRVRATWYKYKNDNEVIKYEISAYDIQNKVTVFFDVDSLPTVSELAGLINANQRTGIDVGKRLSVYKLSEAGIVSLPLIQNQRAIDHDSTVLTLNNTSAAFRERLFLNASEPTEDVLDDDGNPKLDNNGEKLQQFVPLDSGSGTSTWVKGVPIQDEVTADLKGYATPNVIYKDPVDQSGLIASIEHRIRRIYEAMFQAHMLISGDATSSGVSRQQAVQDHISALNLLKGEMEGLITWLFEMLLNWAAQAMGDEGRYADLKCVAECRVSAITPTAEERAAIVNEYNAGLRSQELSMELLGTPDVDADINQINEEDLNNFKKAQALAPPLEPGQDPQNQQQDASKQGGTRVPTKVLTDPSKAK